METQVTGTLVDGVVRLDEQVDIPNNSRVRVALQTIDEAKTLYNEGLNEWLQTCKDHPISSGGLRYTRDQLHERD